MSCLPPTGSIRLHDGRLKLPNNTYSPQLSDGSYRLSDGSWLMPDGNIVYSDGAAAIPAFLPFAKEIKFRFWSGCFFFSSF